MLYSSTRQTHFTAFCSWSTFALSVVCFLLFFFFPSSALKQINIEQNCKLFDWRNALGFSTNFCINLSLCLYGSGAWFLGVKPCVTPRQSFLRACSDGRPSPRWRCGFPWDFWLLLRVSSRTWCAKPILDLYKKICFQTDRTTEVRNNLSLQTRRLTYFLSPILKTVWKKKCLIIPSFLLNWKKDFPSLEHFPLPQQVALWFGNAFIDVS